MAAASVLDCTDWKLRSSMFGELRPYDDGRPVPVMELVPGEPQREREWQELKSRWLELLPHHHILDAIEDEGEALLLRYAAIDWRAAPLSGKGEYGRRLVATWGRQLVDAYLQVLSQFPGAAGYFCRPHLTFDVASRIRIAFLPTMKRETWIPNDVAASWPRCDEAGLVYAIALALRTYCRDWNDDAVEPLKTILIRALDPQPRYRYPSLDSLRSAFAPLAHAPLGEDREAALTSVEEGIAWLQLGEPQLARGPLFEASRRNSELRAAREAILRYHAMTGHGEARDKPPAAPPEPILDADSVAARAASLAGRYDEAIRFADQRLAIDHTDAGIHYLRGRALLVLKRFHEARDAFDRACTLEPRRLEAMLLRREADRAARRVADTVGVAHPMTIDLPEHLMELRDPLAAGRVDEVIPTLERLADDAAAQLVLAECFAYAQRYEEALGAYQRATEQSALRARATLGRARALLFLERANDALAELAGFEGTEANELRAMIRERLS